MAVDRLGECAIGPVGLRASTASQRFTVRAELSAVRAASSIEAPASSASRTRSECLLNVSDAAVTVTVHILARAVSHPGGLSGGEARSSPWGSLGLPGLGSAAKRARA